ncbi:MAG: hypothetical protein WCR42_14515 [bacterium]
MKKYYLVVLVCLISVLISCSTVNKTKTKIKSKPAQVEKELKFKELKYISLMTSIEYSNNGNSNEFVASINQNNDTLGLKVLGPFSMVLAELFSNKEQFFLLDKWNAVLYKGKPTKENFKKALQIPISYQDIIGLIRCNPYGDISRFINDIKQNDTLKSYIYADATAKDSLWIAKRSNTISRYVHKSTTAGESYEVDYHYGESTEYPDKIVFISGKNKLIIAIDKFSLEKFTVKSIKIPDKAKVVDLDETK